MEKQIIPGREPLVRVRPTTEFDREVLGALAVDEICGLEDDIHDAVESILYAAEGAPRLSYHGISLSGFDGDSGNNGDNGGTARLRCELVIGGRSHERWWTVEVLLHPGEQAVAARVEGTAASTPIRRAVLEWVEATLNAIT